MFARCLRQLSDRIRLRRLEVDESKQAMEPMLLVSLSLSLSSDRAIVSLSSSSHHSFEEHGPMVESKSLVRRLGCERVGQADGRVLLRRSRALKPVTFLFICT